MSFTITETEAKILWRMQQPISTDKVYLALEGALSRQYVFMKIRELHLKDFVKRIEIGGGRVLYKATAEAINDAESVLRISSSTE